MGRPRLAEYLLKLATDAEELENYEHGPKRMRAKLEKMPKRERDAALRRERDALLKRAGVTPAQRKRVLTGKSRAIAEAVIAELAKHSSTKDPLYGTALTMVAPINGVHLQHVTTWRPHLQTLFPEEE